MNVFQKSKNSCRLIFTGKLELIYFKTKQIICVSIFLSKVQLSVLLSIKQHFFNIQILKIFRAVFAVTWHGTFFITSFMSCTAEDSLRHTQFGKIVFGLNCTTRFQIYNFKDSSHTPDLEERVK